MKTFSASQSGGIYQILHLPVTEMIDNSSSEAEGFMNANAALDLNESLLG